MPGQNDYDTKRIRSPSCTHWKILTTHAENQWPSGWTFFIPDDLAGDILPQSIAGFKINIEDINFKKKMSQNRSPADRRGIFSGLKGRSDDQSKFVLQMMQSMYSE